MQWPDQAASEERAWDGVDPDPLAGETALENPILVFFRRVFWLLITLLVILSLIAPLIAPFFRTRQGRPKTQPDGLQALLPAAEASVPANFRPF